MLTIAGGIIIAVLVLAYLDVILALGVLAALGIAALFLIVLLYEAAPALTVVLGIIVLVALAYIFGEDAPPAKLISQMTPNDKEFWTVQISGAEAVAELNPENTSQFEDGLKSRRDDVVWHDLGVRHETLVDAMNFARRRHDYYQKKNSPLNVRVVSNLGSVHNIEEISEEDTLEIKIARFVRWGKNKILSVFRK